MDGLRQSLICCATGIVIGMTANLAAAQPPPPTPPQAKQESNTILQVELIAKHGVGLAAQRWGELFSQMGVSLRVRTSALEEPPTVSERKLGPVREVTVVGHLDRSGRLTFADRTFTGNDLDRLSEWLREMQSYGAQGAPEGKPMWGLNQVQFGLLYQLLSEQVPKQTAGESFSAVLENVGAPRKYPFRLSTRTTDLFKSQGEPGKVRQSVVGFSRGTALAIVLAEFGLGFRPLRTPEGAIEFVVDPLTEINDPWPVGWELKQSRQETFPSLFDLKPVEVPEQPLATVLDEISRRSEVPIRIDHYSLAEQGIDIAEKTAKYPKRQSSYSLVLRSVTVPLRLKRELKIDERGQGFVWITATAKPSRPQSGPRP